jgi:uncharacterized membrane protein YraQ (UPF0718 family)
MYYLVAGIWCGVAAVLLWAWRKRPEKLREVRRQFLRNGRVFVGVVPMALLAAGFLSPLVPGELVARWLGESAGVTGIMVAMLAGWCLPVPPVIFFPIIAVLLKAGAGLPQMTALIVAWNVFALHRTLPMELPLMGRYFVTLRLASSLALPLLAGLLAFPVARAFGLS